MREGGREGGWKASQSFARQSVPHARASMCARARVCERSLSLSLSSSLPLVPGEVDAPGGPGVLHAKVELIRVAKLGLLAKDLDGLLLLVEVARAKHIVLVLLEEPELLPVGTARRKTHSKGRGGGSQWARRKGSLRESGARGRGGGDRGAAGSAERVRRTAGGAPCAHAPEWRSCTCSTTSFVSPSGPLLLLLLRRRRGALSPPCTPKQRSLAAFGEENFGEESKISETEKLSAPCGSTGYKLKDLTDLLLELTKVDIE